jgi:hypothetical protein
MLFQYLLLQGNMRRYFAAFIVVTSAIVRAAMILELPMEFGVGARWKHTYRGQSELAWHAGRHRDGFSIILAAQKKKALWLLPVNDSCAHDMLTKIHEGHCACGDSVRYAYFDSIPEILVYLSCSGCWQPARARSTF